MRSPNIAYLPGVDHCRAFAATLIVYYHCTMFLGVHEPSADVDVLMPGKWIQAGNPLSAVIVEGHTAVAFFMVLSGFIFAYGAAGREVRSWPFLRNRLLRIYPLFLTIIFLAISAFPKRFSPLGFLTTVAGLANYPGALAVGPFAVMIWAIGVEMQFYLLFPFLNGHLNRGGPRALLLLLPTALLLRVIGVIGEGNLHMLTYQTILGRIDQFLLGMLAAHLWLARRVTDRAWRRLLLPSAGLVVAALFAFNRLGGYPAKATWKVLWPTLEGGVWALFLLSYLAVSPSIGRRVSAALAKVGELSFSMYLLHHSLTWFVVRRGWVIDPGWGRPTAAVLTTTLVALPIVLAVSALTYNAIEKPFLALRGRYVREA